MHQSSKTPWWKIGAARLLFSARLRSKYTSRGEAPYHCLQRSDRAMTVGGVPGVFGPGL